MVVVVVVVVDSFFVVQGFATVFQVKGWVVVVVD